jgi:hypothetical protein
MKCNVGGVDMAIRIFAGVVLLAVAFLVPMATVWQTVLLVIGVIAVTTSALRYCPLNDLLGINTCRN